VLRLQRSSVVRSVRLEPDPWTVRLKADTTAVQSALVRERIGPDLEVRRLRRRPLPAFDVPRVTHFVPGPQAATLPPGIRILDAAREIPRVEPERIRDAQHYPLLRVR